MSGDQPALYTAGTVARRLGIADATLRSWHRRYGIGPEGHRRGTYRLYTEQDFNRLYRMRQLISEGVLPSQAALIVQSDSRPSAPGLAHPPDLAPKSLVKHALSLDADRCSSIIGTSLADVGIKATWERLCRLALATVSEPGDGSDTIDVTKMLAWVIVNCLHTVSRSDRYASPKPRILLAAVDGEEHVLPLEVLRALLRHQGLSTVFLGPSVPDHTLRQSHGRCAPDVTVLFSIRPETARRDAFQQFDPASLVLAGPGWDHAGVPGQVQHAGSLDTALGQVEKRLKTHRN